MDTANIARLCGDARQWQAGSLIERGGQWIVLEDGKWPWHGNQEAGGPDVMPPDVKLLAPAGGDLWEALRGLPGYRDWHSPAHLCSIDLDGYCKVTINTNTGASHFTVSRHYTTDTAPLEQAIQRFKALQQYIQEATCSQVTT